VITLHDILFLYIFKGEAPNDVIFVIVTACCVGGALLGAFIALAVFKRRRYVVIFYVFLQQVPCPISWNNIQAAQHQLKQTCPVTHSEGITGMIRG
jgi:hypothetical protein